SGHGCFGTCTIRQSVSGRQGHHCEVDQDTAYHTSEECPA
ncbi:hypothetical protein EAG_10669, partial [Camponotus floridanus]